MCIRDRRKTSEGWKLRSNDEIYQSIENITETMRKRRLLFFGHLYRMVNKADFQISGGEEVNIKLD